MNDAQSTVIPGWRIWIDRGGTFTDLVARRPDGRLVTHKLLSEHPGGYDDAAIEGIRALLGVPPGQPLPVGDIASIRMGTTVATNALLERRGDPVLLLITQGFGDALRIADQRRPRLFDRCIRRPEPLYARVLEVPERLSAQGEVLIPFDPAPLRAPLRAALADGLRAVAIVFLHGYRYPAHELRAAELARELGFAQISVSHRVSPLMKLIGRGDTAVVDAALSPLLRRYVDRIAAALGETRLLFMQSNGGLTAARHFHGRDSLLSGPAGGLVGAARVAARAGFDRILTFDMGGTSTDVAHCAGEYERVFETELAGVRVRAPMLDIHTVAAGGGSLCRFDGLRLRVGPESAGADPGPTAYRRGGPLTLTDCNLLLGRLQPDWFPRVCGPARDQPLDLAAVRLAFARLAAEVTAATGQTTTPEALAEGFLAIAVEQMANAIKRISIQRGHDPATHALCGFGGAAGQQVCAVADALGVTTVLLHPLAGLLSAYGMGLAEVRWLGERTLELPLSAAALAELAAAHAALERDGRAALRGQGLSDAALGVCRRVRLRQGQSETALVLALETAAAPETAPAAVERLRDRFAAAHRQRYGFAPPEARLILETAMVEINGLEDGDLDDAAPAETGRDAADATPVPEARIRIAGAWIMAPIQRRAALRPGAAFDGPALVAETGATTLVEPGWRASVDPDRMLVLTRDRPAPTRWAAGTQADPIRLELFNHRFMAIAEQMGATLAHTAQSVNIRERLDFSCALFDPDGALIANAPHIPVHLGSMGEAVRALLRARSGMLEPGAVYVSNDPYAGGTHLPDLTVITPVFAADGRTLLFHVAARGHHADIGGTAPGSMPPDSTRIDAEGIRLDGLQIVRDGQLLETVILDRLRAGPWPARNPAQNLADLRAQIAANATGARELRRLLDEFGAETVRAYMGHVQAHAAEQVRRVLDRLADGAFVCELDQGTRIQVAIRVDHVRRRACIDFAGTSPQQPDNFNAPRAVTLAAVLYVFRTLVDEDIPLNAGCLEPLEIRVPPGSLLDPRPPAAVVAGNVETSQCVVDALYGALGVLAGSQGTMNNLTFGNARHQYYETLGGGAGAGPGCDGATAVHTHMTNSRLTDPEVLEWRYPVRVESFGIRAGSGGAGRWRGGDGLIRRLRFLEPMTAAILSGRRRIAPHGLAGGAPGLVGRNALERADGTVEELPGRARREVAPGDILRIETPGGGGYGAAEPDA